MKLVKAFLLILMAFPLIIWGQKNIDHENAEWVVEQQRGEYNEVEFKVDQGTWMHLDISPDSKTIVFDLLGDIYSMSSTGGKAKLLTSDIAWQMQPKFSPDGKEILFVSDQGGGENLWVMDIDGENKRAITHERFRMLNSPSWSPNGLHVVARKHFTGIRSLGAGEIWMYPKNGEKGVALVERPNQQKDIGEPAFSPDGQYVYYSQDTTPGAIFEYSKDSEKGIYSIKRIHLDTGEIETVISGRGGAIRPTPSPDGTKLAYISRVDFQSTLFIYDLITGERTSAYNQLDRDKQASWAIHGVYPSMAWTPDNKHLVFWANGKINKLNTSDLTSEVVPFQVSETKKIGKALRFPKDIDVDNFEIKMPRNLEVSPNGKEVVFEALGHIYTKKLPNGKPQRLTKQNDYFEFDPSYSRDGKYIVFATWHDSLQGNIQMISRNTGLVKKLLSGPGKFIEPVFSPDGQTVVYRKFAEALIMNPSGNAAPGIYKVSINDGNPEKIVTKGRAAHFGANGKHIYFLLDAEVPELHRIDIDGKNEQTLYQSKYATEFKVSPNGTSLAIVYNYRVYLAPFSSAFKTVEILAENPGSSAMVVSKRAGENISFNGKGDQLFWNLGPNVFQTDVSDWTGKPYEIISTSINLYKKMDKPEGTIALIGGKIITMEGNEIIENGTILVQNNKIVAVGPQDSVIVPNYSKIIDITGKTVIPGIVDTHSHGSQGSNEVIPQQNWKAFATLCFGVTTIFNPNTDTSQIFTASELQKAGEIVSPRIFSTGKSLYGAYEPGHTAFVNNLDDARFHMDRLKEVGAFAIKMHHHPRREQYQQMIQAAREAKLMVLSEGGALLQQDLGKIADGASSIEHSMSLAKIYDDVRLFWAGSQAGYIPTLVVAMGGIAGENYWYAESDVWKHPLLSKYVPQDILAPRSMRRTMAPLHHYNHFNVVKIVKELNDLGVMIGIGGHGQREGLGAHWEIWMMVQGGMTPHEALKAATIIPAKHLGLEKNIGSIKIGKLADLVIIDGDVLSDIRQSDKIHYVMLNGRLYDARSMNEIGNRKRIRQSFYFE